MEGELSKDEKGDAGKESGPIHRVVMWGPPRSLSTTVERALVEHPLIYVLHEPFGVPFYWSGKEAQSTREVAKGAEQLHDTFADVAHRVFDEAPPAGKKFVFSKNLSYYFAPHCLPQMKEMLGGDYGKVCHSFMIRHPAKAISSLYFKSCIDNEKTGYTHFDPTEAGYTAMAELMEHLEAIPECPPIVIIDADDLLEDPEGIMRAYCHGLGLPFDTSILTWQPGPVPELASPWSGWTDDVQNSSGITRRAKRSAPPDTSSLPTEVQETIAEAMPIYDRMFARRILPMGPQAAKLTTADMPTADEANGEAKAGGSSPLRAANGAAGADASSSALPPLCACCPEPAKLTGIFLLLTSVAIWVGQAELLQSIHNDAWSKPYFQAASLKSAWVLALPVWYALTQVNKFWQDEITFRRPLQPSLKVVGLSLGLTVLVQASSATWIASLGLTSVSVNSAIYNINPLLVYVLSIPLLQERPSVTKSAAVLVAMVGTSIVTLGSTNLFSTDGRNAEGALLGNGLVILSACLFALKEVLFKKHFASVSISLTPFTDALLVVGLIGLGSVLTLAPMTWLFDRAGVEAFELPAPELARSYAMVALLMATYQACLLASIALTSPTFVAMGTMLAIPGSIAFDFVIKGYLISAISLAGICLILLAFFGLAFSQEADDLLGVARQKAMRSCEPNRRPSNTAPADAKAAHARGATALI